ncbi:DMT family transporter [Acinetobacter baumannii]
MSPRTQGYFFVLVTMCIWGGFTLLARLNAQWHISAWDIAALRFAIAFLILMPILIYKKDLAFLWSKHAVILALIGGVIYCLTVYTAFLYAPAAHAAIFLNGCIPICTAIAAYILFRQPFDKHTWVSLAIMITALALMSALMLQSSTSAFGIGDLLLFISAIWWGIFTVLLKQWKLSAWHSMASVAIWSAIIYLPIYLLFLPKHFTDVDPLHLAVQSIFHGVFVVIIATLTYVAAIQRLGAFKTGSIVTLAPFIAAILAVPLLGESLSPSIVVGLVGMGIGALQPWRWFRQDSLTQKIKQQNTRN